MMIARIVEEDMDYRQQRIHGFYRFQQPDCGGRVDSFDVDHSGVASLEINRAVNVESSAPVSLLNRQIFAGRRPAPDGTRRMCRMHGVHEQNYLVGAEGIEKVLIGGNERLLLFHVEIATNRFRLAIFEPQPMQQSDQSRAALINDAELLLDKGADLTCRTWQGLGYKGDERRFLRRRQMARTAAAFEPFKTSEPGGVINLAPASDRVVVHIEGFGDPFAAPAVVQQQDGVGATRNALFRATAAQQDKKLSALRCGKLDDPQMASYPGAQFLVFVTIEDIWINCPRYIHPHQKLANSRYVPDGNTTAPLPAWKRLDIVQEAIPARDRDQVSGAGGEITMENYVELLMKGEA